LTSECCTNHIRGLRIICVDEKIQVSGILKLKKLNGREMKALWVLSILVPISLLTMFRFAGVLHEPPLPETITVNEATWIIERPSSHVYVDERVENNFTSDVLSAKLSVFIGAYEENARYIPFEWGSVGRDGVIFRPYINLTFTQGSIESILISFHPSETTVALYVHSSVPPLREHNLTVTEIEPSEWAENHGDAFIKAEASRSPCGLDTQVYWVFDDENNQSHQLEVTLEIVYFNENASQEITIPIVLAVPIQPY
jgi:hypothetical protein